MATQLVQGHTDEEWQSGALNLGPWAQSLLYLCQPDCLPFKKKVLFIYVCAGASRDQEVFCYLEPEFLAVLSHPLPPTHTHREGAGI